MPLRTIAPENRVGLGGQRFPRLEYKAKGEFHRVLLFQKNADGQPVVWQEYVHPLRVPLFGDDGLPKMTLKDSKRGDDEKYEDYDTDSLGFPPICLGDPDVIEAEGYDAAGCPVCKRVPDAPGEAKLAPQLRFAVNVVEYALAPGSWKVQKPLSAKVVVWAFGPSVYDDIISQQDQHGELLQKRDLTLEVISAKYKTQKMGVMEPSGWTESANGGAYLKELLGDPANIASEDQLRAACGKDSKRLFMEEDVATVVKKWRKALVARGELDDDPAGNAALGGGQRSLDAGITEMLQGNPAAAALAQETARLRDQARQEATAAIAPEDPFGDGTASTANGATTTPTAAPAAESPSPTEPKSVPPASGPDDPFGLPADFPAAAPQSSPAADGSSAQPSPATSPPSDKPKSFDDLIGDLGGVG